MPKSTRGTSSFVIVFIALILLHVALINATRLFPFTDLPNHLAAATIHRHYGEPGNRFHEIFSLDLFPKPNVLHMLFCGLPIFPSVEFANRIYLSLYAAALPAALLALIRRFRGNRWFALLAFPLIYNYSASWGFMGFLLALPIVLFSFALMSDLIERGGAWRGSLLAVLLVLLFLAHALAALFALLLFVVMLSVRSRGDTLRFLQLFPSAIPCLLLFAAWLRGEPGGMESLSALGGYYAGDFIQTFPRRVHLLFLDNYHLMEGKAGVLAASLLSLAIIVPSLAALRGAIVRGEWRRIRGSAPFILLLCALGCFLLLPHEIPRQAVLYQRFSAPALLALALLGATASGRGTGRGRERRWGVAVLFAAATLVHLALWTDHFTGFNRENDSFAPGFFPEGGKGTLAGLVLDQTYRGRPSYIHFPSYYIVWRRGIAVTKIADYRFSNVRRKWGGAPLPPYLEWVGSRGGYDGRYADADLLLVRGEPLGAAALAVRGREPLREEGAWTLYGAPSVR
jgi:hypothetical protein